MNPLHGIIPLKPEDKRGFSIIEVVIAIGIFTVAILALVGLLAGNLQTVNTVVEKDEAISLVSKVSSFLESQRFEDVYEEVYDPQNPLALIAYSAQENIDDIKTVEQRITFADNNQLSEEWADIVGGSVYKIIVRVAPWYRGVDENGGSVDGQSGLPASPAQFAEGYLPLSVSVYSMPRPSSSGDSIDTSAEINPLHPEVLNFNLAINR